MTVNRYTAKDDSEFFEHDEERPILEFYERKTSDNNGYWISVVNIKHGDDPEVLLSHESLNNLTRWLQSLGYGDK